MNGSTQHEITHLLRAWSEGQQGAPERLMPLVYEELRRLARSYMLRERPDHTLQTTALVHEAYLRLVDVSTVNFQDRAHFFGMCALLMRRILVDSARSRASSKRGGELADLASLEKSRPWWFDFLNMLADAGIESVKLPPRSPNLNAYAERFVRTIKESCLERMILFGEESLRTAIREFVAHYHTECNHQGLDNQLLRPEAGHFKYTGVVKQRQRLGGMLNYYYRDAA